MSESCNKKGVECESDCEKCSIKDLREKPHELSSIKKVIGVASGKGGVGKTLVTSLLAVMMQRKGCSCAILDADITGPSIPKAFGITEKASQSDLGVYPVKSKTGIDIMSINLLLPNDTDPVLWRGPIIAGTVKQFWTDIIWGDIDFLFVDLPPGTGDVPLTVFQSIPIDGIIVVTSPQELVSMIVGKAIKMAKMMEVPILGLVENMSWAICPDCGKAISVFGKSRLEETAQKYGVSAIDKLPIDPVLTELSDNGMIESFEGTLLENITSCL